MRRLPAQTRIVNHDLQIAGKQKGRVAVGFSTSRPCDGRLESAAAAVSFKSAPLPALTAVETDLVWVLIMFRREVN